MQRRLRRAAIIHCNPDTPKSQEGGIRGRLMSSSEQLSLPGLDTPSPFSRKTKHGWKDERKLYLLETRVALLEVQNMLLVAALKQATIDLTPSIMSWRN